MHSETAHPPPRSGQTTLTEIFFLIPRSVDCSDFEHNAARNLTATKGTLHEDDGERQLCIPLWVSPLGSLQPPPEPKMRNGPQVWLQKQDPNTVTWKVEERQFNTSYDNTKHANFQGKPLSYDKTTVKGCWSCRHSTKHLEYTISEAS